jgi:gliding motility-associated-like protein
MRLVLTSYLIVLLSIVSIGVNGQVGCDDNDNDGTCDNVDFDDDNDGILDVDECMTSNFHWSDPPTVNGKIATGIINGLGYTYTSSINIETTPTIYKHEKFPNSFNIPNIKVIKNRIASNNSVVFTQPVLNPILVFSSIGSGGGAVPIKFSNPIDVLFQAGPVTINSPTQITGQEGYVVIRMNGVFNEISFDYLANENYVNFTFGADFATFCDTDNDGTPDYLDLDSDDDGCPDAVEGNAGFKLSDINNGVLAGNRDANGVPLAAAGGQDKGSSADATTESLVCEACATEKPAINGINGDPFHAFYFDAIQELNETVVGLATGEKYKIKVTGTWSVWSNDPTKNVLDAAYRYKEKNGSSDITPVNSLNWFINGSLPNRPSTDGYNPDHTYFFEQVATGNGEVFTFDDNNYGDNGGGMNFEFYKILDTIKVCASNTITPLTDFAVGQDLKWYSSETSNDGTAVLPSINNSITGLREYWVTQTINNCESDRVQLLYLVNEIPFINLGNDTTICTGASLSLDAGNYQNYTWSTTENTQTIDVTTTGDYSVEVTNSKACTGNSSIYVTFNPCVFDFFKTDTLYVCQGDSISIASNGIKNGIWFGENGFTQIHDSLIKVSPLVSSWYGVGNQGGVTKGTNKIVNGDFENGGTGFTSEYVEDCFANPWMQQGGYCVSTDPRQQNQHWTSCGDHTSGTGNMFITDAATELGAKIWCQTVTVNPNSDYEFSAWIQSVMAPNPAVLEFQINGVLLGSNLNASSSPCEWETYAAQWSSGVSTSAEICLANKNTNGGGNDFALDDIYFGEVTTVTSDESDSVFVVVNSKPIVTLGNDTTICIEEAVTFDAGTGYYSYDWSTGELTHKINVNSSGTYKVEITNDNGCTQVDSVELIVNQLPVVVLGNDTTICADSAVTFDALTGKVWTWSNGYNTPTTTVNSTGEYSVIVADEIGCTGYDTISLVMQALPVVNLGDDTIICNGESIVLDAENIRFNYSWNTGERTQAITIVTTGIYGVEVTDEIGCLGSDSIELKVNPMPSVNLGNDTAVCIGESVMLDAQNPGFNYLWSTGEIIKEITINSTGDYEVEVYDAIGCADTGSINLLVKELPVVELGNDTVICEYQSVVLSAENAGLNYLWNSGATSQTINVDQEGLYSVEVRDSIGCLGVNEIYVTKEVIEDPYLEKNYTICEGTSIILEPDFPKLYTIIWELDLNDSFLEVSESGAYSSYVISEFCRDTFIVNVTKIDTPDAVIVDLRGEENYCFDIESTTLMISSQDAGDIFYWEGFERSDEVLIGAAGDFNVTVSNVHCSSDYTYKVEEYCEGKFFIPNAFTPEDDNGLNEVFMPVSNGHVDGYDFRIYNRWGVLIFQTKIQGKGWDGNVSDRLVQADVYVYRIGYNYKAETGGVEHREQVGTVTLLR